MGPGPNRPPRDDRMLPPNMLADNLSRPRAQFVAMTTEGGLPPHFALSVLATSNALGGMDPWAVADLYIAGNQIYLGQQRPYEI